MAPPTPAPTHAPSVTVAWLVRLRWGSIVGQGVTLLVGLFGLGVPWSAWAAVVLGLTIASNVALQAAARSRGGLPLDVLGGVLVLDTAALTGLLLVCGGPSNPFSTLYLVYVTVAALALGMRWALVAVGVSAVGYAFLFFATDQAATMAHMHRDATAFSVHLQGMWVAFTVTGALIATFVARVARALREREEQLAEAREAAVRAEKLASLSTLAAGAAHELGTPLSTIAVVARELERALEALPDNTALIEDARLVREEVARCRDILQHMSGRSGEAMGESVEPIAVESLLDRVRTPPAVAPANHATVSFSFDVDASVPSKLMLPVRGLVQSLRNLVRNALDAGGPADGVKLRVRHRQGRVAFEVEDQGAGMPSDVLGRVGEPFFTTKLPGKGTGLGVFLARTFAERWQGQLTLRSKPGRGTLAILELPAAPFDDTEARDVV